MREFEAIVEFKNGSFVLYGTVGDTEEEAISHTKNNIVPEYKGREDEIVNIWVDECFADERENIPVWSLKGGKE